MKAAVVPRCRGSLSYEQSQIRVHTPLKLFRPAVSDPMWTVTYLIRRLRQTFNGSSLDGVCARLRAF